MNIEVDVATSPDYEGNQLQDCRCDVPSESLAAHIRAPIWVFDLLHRIGRNDKQSDCNEPEHDLKRNRNDVADQASLLLLNAAQKVVCKKDQGELKSADRYDPDPLPSLVLDMLALNFFLNELDPLLVINNDRVSQVIGIILDQSLMLGRVTRRPLESPLLPLRHTLVRKSLNSQQLP